MRSSTEAQTIVATDEGHHRKEWADIIRDLDQVQETTFTVDGNDYVLRSEIKGTLSKVFHAAGVAIPPVVRAA